MKLLSVFLLVYLAGVTLNKEVSDEACPANCRCSSTEEGSSANCSSTGLSQLPKLSEKTRALLMSANGISSFDVTWQEKKLPHLYGLILSHNNLQSPAVSQSSFSSVFLDLQTLDLSYNKLDTIPTNLPGTLKALLLSNNVIKSVQAKELTDLDLETLFLDGNMLSAIDELSFKIPPFSPDYPPAVVLQSLKYLEMSNNSIREIHDYSLTGLSQLEALSLANNNLSELAVNTFKGLRNLQYLDATYNGLNSIQNQTFKHLTSLKVLYLNNNNLAEIPQGMPFLDWADFSGNVIKHIDEVDLKKDIYPIEMLNIANNPLHCDCKLLWLKELWDRREYVVDQNKIEPDNFVPVCESPASLRGEMWTFLGDDVFVCDKSKTKDITQSGPPPPDEHFPDMSVFDQYTNLENVADGLMSIEKGDSLLESLYIQDYPDVTVSTETAQGKLELSAEDVKEHSVIVTWQGAIPNTVTHFFVRYHTFGRANSPLFSQVSSDSTFVHLEGLQPQTNYVICLVIPSANGNLPDAVDLENCIETTTKSYSIFSRLPFDDKSLDYHFKVLFCSFVISCVICGVGLVIYEICSRVICKVSEGYHAKKHKD